MRPGGGSVTPPSEQLLTDRSYYIRMAGREVTLGGGVDNTAIAIAADVAIEALGATVADVTDPSAPRVLWEYAAWDSSGTGSQQTATGASVAVINIMGRVHMPLLDDPFDAVARAALPGGERLRQVSSPIPPARQATVCARPSPTRSSKDAAKSSSRR